MRRTSPQELLPLSPLSIAILLSLVDEARHGYAIIKDLERETQGRIAPGAGTLYAALQRMVDDAMITETAGPSNPAEDRRRRYYALTAFGRDVARAELLRLARMIDRESARHLLPELRLILPRTTK